MLEIEIIESFYSLAGPSAFEPCETLGVEIDCPAGSVAGSADRLMR